jgi:hypothetical protein
MMRDAVDNLQMVVIELGNIEGSDDDAEADQGILEEPAARESEEVNSTPSSLRQPVPLAAVRLVKPLADQVLSEGMIEDWQEIIATPCPPPQPVVGMAKPAVDGDGDESHQVPSREIEAEESQDPITPCPPPVPTFGPLAPPRAQTVHLGPSASSSFRSSQTSSSRTRDQETISPTKCHLSRMVGTPQSLAKDF